MKGKEKFSVGVVVDTMVGSGLRGLLLHARVASVAWRCRFARREDAEREKRGD